MKMMLWKELRENFKWALLALLALTLAEFYTLSAARGNQRDPYNNLTLCDSSFLSVTAFGCAAVAAALGAVQILPELRRDQWAALLHRPVPRDVIFFGKAAAGLLLYLFAATIPFLASIAYVATPGEFGAPLVPGMTLPGFSDIAMGAVFYFAALLLALHRGRWFGSRGLIALSLLPLFLAHLSLGWPFLLPAITAAVFLVAAWDAMRNSAGAPRRPWLARAALVAIVLLGAETAWAVIVLGLQFLPTGQHLASTTYRDFRITRDGTVLIATERGDDSSPVLTDTNGKPVTDPKYVGNDGSQNFLQTLPVCFTHRPPPETPALFRSPRMLMGYVTRTGDMYMAKEDWFALVAQRYLIGYDKLSRRSVGLVDRDGFEPPGAIPKPFAAPIQEPSYNFAKPYLYWSGPRLEGVDFTDRSVKPLLDAGGDVIHGAINLGSEQPGKFSLLIVALDRELRLLDPAGEPVATIPYGRDPDVWPVLSAAINPDLRRLYLQYAPDFYGAFRSFSPPNTPNVLDELDEHGAVLRTYQLPSDLELPGPPTWQDHLAAWTSPLLTAAIGTVYHVFYPQPAESHYWFEISGPSYSAVLSPPASLLDGTLLVLVGAGLAAITFAWARRAGFPPRNATAWALFVFGFGLAGLVAFRFASTWPTRVPCPACGAPRDVEDETCPACGKAWPAPARTGTEIIEAVSAM